MSWQNSVNMLIGTVACPQVDSFVAEIDYKKESPIDYFYASTTDILTKCNPDFINNYGQDISGLLLIGLISATENYFRDILGLILSICPISQSHSVEQKIQLGSLLWGPADLYNRSAFEFLALSSARNIKETFNSFINYQIKQQGAWYGMLKDYDKLCEFRHAVVHSGHIIAGKNAIKLNLRRSKKIMKVDLTFANLQASGRLCTALVQAANNELFELFVTRWATDWRILTTRPDLTNEKNLILIRKSFVSKRDMTNTTISNKVTNAKFVTEVKLAFNL